MAAVQDPSKRKKLYDYLSGNDMTDLSFDDFSNEYGSNIEKQSNLYSYLKSNNLTDLDPESFASEYFGDLKKKEASVSTSASTALNQELVSGTTDGFLGISEDRPTYNLEDKYRLSPEEWLEAQERGFAPPPSVEISLSRPKMDSSPEDYMNQSWEERQDSYTPFKESFVKSDNLKEKVGTGWKPETNEEKSEFSRIKSLDFQMKDLNIQQPYKYFSEANKSDYNDRDEFIENNFGYDNLISMGIDPVDFDGFINKKGYKEDFLDKESRGLFESSDYSWDHKLAQEQERYRMLSLYIADMNKRAVLREKLNAEIESGTPADMPDPVFIFNEEEVSNFIKNEFPIYSKVVEERKEKEKEILKKHIDGEAGFWFRVGGMVNRGWDMFAGRINDISATTYDKIGFDTIADEIRYSKSQSELAKPNDRLVSYVSGKSGEHNGRKYLVDSKGRVIDSELKIDVTDVLNPFAYKDLMSKSKDWEDDWTLSGWGMATEVAGVTTDLIVQIAATAALSRVGINPLASSMIAQGALGYSQGLEDAMESAREYGLTESESAEFASSLAREMGAWYVLTSVISPQTKGADAMFGISKKKFMEDAVKAYSRTDKKALGRFVDNVAENYLSKRGIRNLAVDFNIEGAKETIQENIQQLGEVNIKQRANRISGQEILEAEDMTGDDIFNTTIISYIVGGMPSMLKFSSNRTTDKLLLLKSVNDSNVDVVGVLDNLEKEEVITNEFRREFEQDLKAYRNNIGRIPDNLDSEIALEVLHSLERINELETKKESLDSAFHSEVDEEIKSEREKISNLTKRFKKEASKSEVESKKADIESLEKERQEELEQKVGFVEYYKEKETEGDEWQREHAKEFNKDVKKGLEELIKLQEDLLEEAVKEGDSDLIEFREEAISDIKEELRLYEEINAKYDSKYVDAVKKGEMTKEQAMQALEEIGRKNSDAYAEIAALENTESASDKKADIERINKERAEYGLEPLKPTYRGTSLEEWENIKNGEVASSDNMQDATWVSDKKEYSEEYVKTGENRVLIEFKPEAIDKSTVESGQENDDTGVRIGRGLRLEDVQKVTDSEGRVIYDAEIAALENKTETETETDGDITGFIDVAPEEVTDFDNLLEGERRKLEELERKHGKNHYKTQEQRAIVNVLEKNTAISVEFKDGKTIVKGRGSDNPRTRREAIKKEIEEGLYDGIPETDLEGVPPDRIGEHIAEHSESPIEVVEALEHERNQRLSEKESIEDDLEDYIAYHLKNSVSIKSYEDATGHKSKDRPRGLTQSYLRKDGVGLDVLAQNIEYEFYGDYNANSPRVTEQMLIDFMENYPSISEYKNRTRNVSTTEIALENRFMELTGLHPNKSNINLVRGRRDKQVSDVGKKAAADKGNPASKSSETTKAPSKAEANLPPQIENSTDAEFEKWYKDNGGEALGEKESIRKEWDDMNQSERDNYVPFQSTKETFKPISRRKLNQLVRGLQRAFKKAGKKVRVHTGAKKMADRLKELSKRGYNTPRMQHEYRMSHTAPTRDDGLSVSIDRLNEIYPDDVYSNMGWHYYGDGDRTMDKQSHAKLRSLKGKPDAKVTIYRAVPKGVTEIKDGDWITINRNYAVRHGESNIDGDYDIISLEVRADQVFTDANSLHEQGIKFLQTKDGTVYGFVDPVTGDIYMDGDLMNANTPIHEFAHLWISIIQQSNPKLWERMVNVAKETPEWNRLANDPNYKQGQFKDKKGKALDNAIADEVWASIIGNRGENNFEAILEKMNGDRTLAQKVWDAVKDFWQAVVDLLYDAGIFSGDVTLPNGVRLQVAASHGTPHQFPKELLVAYEDGTTEYLVGTVNTFPEVPEGARVVKEFPKGRFRLDKIGAGEGAQAFGWGLYFADLKSIAKIYATKLSQGLSTSALSDSKPLPESAWEEISPIMRKYNIAGDMSPNQTEAGFVREIIDNNKEKLTNQELKTLEKYAEKSNRNLYSVTLHKGKTPDQYTWLEWDKSVPKTILDKIADGFETLFGENISIGEPTTGEEVYDAIIDVMSRNRSSLQSKYGTDAWGRADKLASLFLLDAGIDGVKYPAESISRGARSDNARGFNYVVFDENAVTIEEHTRFQQGNQTASDQSLQNPEVAAIADMALGQMMSGEFGTSDPVMDFAMQYASESELLRDANGNVIGVKPEVLEEIRKEREQIEREARANGTWMKAPNGKKSKLNEKQWVTVRTKRFKNWFGDWLNDPENASKVVDGNGEPMVVYHGTPYGSISEFNVGSDGGIYFNSKKKIADSYQSHRGFGLSQSQSGNTESVFLNIRDAQDINALNKIYNNIPVPYQEYKPSNFGVRPSNAQTISDVFKHYLNEGKDGVIIRNVVDSPDGKYDTYYKGDVIVVSNPNQIKSATGNVGTFSNETGDIRFQKEKKSNLQKSKDTPIFNRQSKVVQEHIDVSYGSAEAFENNVNTVVNQVSDHQLQIDFDNAKKGEQNAKWEKQYKLDFSDGVRHGDSDSGDAGRSEGRVPQGRHQTDEGRSKPDNRVIRTVRGELRERTVLEGFKESGYVDIVGTKVKTPQDIADLFLIHRSPLIEKGHIVYLKDGKILKTTAETIGATAGTSIDGNRMAVHTARELGADKVVFLHNHPSGNHKPSPQDIDVTQLYSRLFGSSVDFEHIVIDTEKFTLINRDGTFEYLDYKKKPKPLFSKRIKADNSDDLMGIATSLSKGGAPNAIIYLAHNLTITGYDIIDGSENLAEYVSTNAKPQGATRFAVVSDGSTPAIESFANSNIKGLLTHIRITGESAFESVKDQGYIEGDDGKFVQLWENKTEYGTEAQTEKTRAEKFLDLLDSWESEIDKFGRETLGINIPAVVAKGMINMMRLTVKGGLSVTQAFNAGMDYIRETDWYKKLSETDKAKVDSNTFRTVITNAVRQAIDAENKLNKIREKLNELTKSQAEKPKTKTERKERVENEKRIRQEVVDDLVQFLSKNKIEGRITATEVNRLIRYAARIATDSNAQKAFDRFLDAFNKVEINAARRANSRNTEEIQRIDVTSKVDEMLNAGMNESDIINSFETKWQRDVAFDHIERQRDITDEEASKEWDRISEDYDNKFRDKKPLKKRAKKWVNAVRKALFSSQIHAEDLTEKSGLRRTRNLLRNFHGAKGLAKTVFDDAYTKIWGVEGGKKGHWALKPKLRDALHDLIFHRRVIELEDDYIAKGKEPVMHTGGWNKKKAEAKLREMKKELGEKTFNDLMRRSDIYFDTFKRLLKDKYDAGLISKESYESMKDLNYSPRMLASILLDFDGDLTERGKSNRSNRNGKTDAEIRSMGEGSLEHFFKESDWLLATALNSGYRNIAQNRLNNMLFREMKVQRERFEKIDAKVKAGEKLRRSETEFYDAYKELSEKIIDNPIVGFKKDGSPKYKYSKPPSHHFVESYRWVDGVRHSFFVESKLAEEWFANREGFLHPKAKWWISTLSGSRLVKYIATGNNPTFLISNTPRDAIFNYVFSDEFSPISIVGVAQMLKDSFNASVDIVKHDFNLGENLLETLYDYGLSMEFLSTQGRIESNKILDLFPKQQKDNFQFVWRNLTLQQMQTGNELMFRVGLAQRTIANFLKQNGIKDVNQITENLAKEKGYENKQDMIDDMYETAVSQARGILDFSRGGWLSKDLEAFIPYTNVALQSTGKLLEALHRNPKETTVKLAQVMGIMSTLPMMASIMYIALRYNPDDDDEEQDGKWKSAFKVYFETMDGLSKYERTNYAHIPLGIKDENGNWMAIRIAKEHALTAPLAVSDYYTQNFVRKLAGVKEESSAGLQGRLGFALRKNYAASITPQDFITDIPIARAFEVHRTGYDSFRDQYLPGTEAKVKYGIHSLQGEGLTNPNVEEFWKAMGEQFYLSPIRTKYAVESIITSPSTNPMIGLLYGGADVVWSQDKTMREIRDGLVDNISKSPFKRVIISANDYNRGYADREAKEKEDDKFRYKLQKRNKKENDLIKEYMDGNISGEEFMKEAEKIRPEDPKKVRDKLKKRMKDKGVSWELLNLRSYSLEERARAIWQDYGDILDSSNREVLIEMKKAGGILTDNFWKYYRKEKNERLGE